MLTIYYQKTIQAFGLDIGFSGLVPLCLLRFIHPADRKGLTQKGGENAARNSPRGPSSFLAEALVSVPERGVYHV